MKEIITVQIGKVGNTVGSMFWEDISHEHDIAFNNKPIPNQSPLNLPEIFFQETRNNSFTPRAVLIDSDPSTLNSLQSKSIFSLVPQSSFISGTHGHDMNLSLARSDSALIEAGIESVRKLSESCENLQAFQIFHSAAGGTGSGVMAMLLERIMELDYSKTFVTFTCFPSPQISDLPLETLNTAFCLHSLIEFSNLSVVLDSEKTLNSYVKLSEFRDFDDLNQITRKHVSDFTCLLRFPGRHLGSYKKITNFMSVYPRMHFVNISSSFELPRMGKDELIAKTLSPSNIYYQDLITTGNYAAVGVSRGDLDENVVKCDENEWVRRNRNDFVRWLPSNLIHHHTEKAHRDCEYSYSLIKNAANNASLFRRLSGRFSELIKKKRFTELFTNNGVEQEYFDEVETNLNDLCLEYLQNAQECDEEANVNQ